MTRKKAKPLAVAYAVDAVKELDEIWDWNAKTYGREHAAKYVGFLGQYIETLGIGPQEGRVVSTRPDLRYLPIKRKNRGHGHVVVYSVDQHAVNILHIFHTAQDWETKLAGRMDS